MAAAERRRADSNVLSQSQALNQGSALARRGPSDLITSPQPPPLHGMHNPLHTPLPPHNMGQPRPGLERSMSFPTPPSSASSVMGVNTSDGSFWNNGMVPGQGGQQLAIDTVGNSRSLPTTPATTPPGGLQQLQQYPQQPSLYNQQASMPQHSMQRYNQTLPQPSQYMNQGRESNMGPPPSSRPTEQSLSRPPSRQQDVKDENDQSGLSGEHDQHSGQPVHGGDEHAHQGGNGQDSEYPPQDGGYAHSHRYYPPLNTEHNPHLSPELTGSPNHGQTPATPVRSTYGANVPRTVDNGSGATPRTATTPQSQWSNAGYSTPPSNGGPQQSGRYQLATGDPVADNLESSGAASSNYGPPSGLGVTMPNQGGSQNYSGLNGTPGSSTKRLRDDEEEHGSRPSSRGQDDRSGEPEIGGLKRRKTTGSAPTAGMATGSFDRNSDARLNRTRSTVNPPRVGGRR